MTDLSKILFRPELYFRDGRIVRNFAEAVAMMREHEPRPGVDDRDEVLHGLERARSQDERRQAAEAFAVWASELDLLLASPALARRG
ncbi:MAG: hypothetical protein QOD74_123 [Variibacter sp.]|nr:hypothetical protein [Variibacter sp.]